MYKFKGNVRNELFAEDGVNITVKGLQKEKIILAPTGPWYEIDKELDSNTLNLTFTPSSGNTDLPRIIGGEIKNGTDNITTHPTHWEIELKGTSEKETIEVQIVIYEADMRALEAMEDEKNPEE